MKHRDTVIFDLDGTLLDTLQDLTDSVNYALAVNHMGTRTVDEVRRFVGNGVARLMMLAVPDGTAGEAEAKALADFRAHYITNMDNKTVPYPGIQELLHTLSSQGFRLAVVSNKFDGAVKGLCQTFFSDTISVAIGEAPHVAKKPAPDTVLRALDELGSDAGRTVYVGDSDVDIETARSALLPCISVSWGFRDTAFLKAHGASHIADTPRELLELLCSPE